MVKSKDKVDNRNIIREIIRLRESENLGYSEISKRLLDIGVVKSRQSCRGLYERNKDREGDMEIRKHKILMLNACGYSVKSIHSIIGTVSMREIKELINLPEGIRESERVRLDLVKNMVRRVESLSVKDAINMDFSGYMYSYIEIEERECKKILIEALIYIVRRGIIKEIEEIHSVDSSIAREVAHEFNVEYRVAELSTGMKDLSR